MSTYAIGDLQGCHEELLELLDEINFDKNKDQLWFVGDLINRGPESLKTLRFVKKLGASAITVLGNHDLHLLAIANGQEQYMHSGDTLEEILAAPDKGELLTWLRQQPLAYQHKDLGFTMIHAGLPPQWETGQACEYAKEVETALVADNFKEYFANMYGNQPDQWSDDLQGWERLRFITNCLTRLRYCDADGRLNFKEKLAPGKQAKDLHPWFEIEYRKSRNDKLIFGHWASLRDYEIDYEALNVFPTDMGCVWGGRLVAFRLEDESFFSVPSRQEVKLEK